MPQLLHIGEAHAADCNSRHGTGGGEHPEPVDAEHRRVILLCGGGPDHTDADVVDRSRSHCPHRVELLERVRRQPDERAGAQQTACLFGGGIALAEMDAVHPRARRPGGDGCVDSVVHDKERSSVDDRGEFHQQVGGCSIRRILVA